MGTREQALSRLAERQAAERAMVRTMTKRLDAATAATAAAGEALAQAEATRAAVLVEWAGQPGWTAAAIAEHTGVPVGEVNAALRAARPRSAARRGSGSPLESEAR